MEQRRQPAGQEAWRELWELLRHVALKLGAVLLFAMAGAAIVFLLPVIVPLIALTEWLARRRKRAAAFRTACLRCGQVLGAAAVERGDEVWAAEMRARSGTFPGVRFRPRVVRALHAICTNCGARYCYDEGARAFHPVPDVLPEVTEPPIAGLP